LSEELVLLTHQLCCSTGSNYPPITVSRPVKETSKRISEFTQQNAAIYYLPSEIYLIPVKSMSKMIIYSMFYYAKPIVPYTLQEH
jgi:hypothetical protein